MSESKARHEDREIIKEGICLRFEDYPVPTVNVFGCCCPGRPPPPGGDGEWVRSYICLKKPRDLDVYLTEDNPILLAEINLGKVMKHITYGSFSRGVPSRPKPPDEYSDFRMLAIPEAAHYNGKIHWFSFQTDDELKEWLSAICDSLPLPLPLPETVQKYIEQETQSEEFYEPINDDPTDDQVSTLQKERGFVYFTRKDNNVKLDFQRKNLDDIRSAPPEYYGAYGVRDDPNDHKGTKASDIKGVELLMHFKIHGGDHAAETALRSVSQHSTMKY